MQVSGISRGLLAAILDAAYHNAGIGASVCAFMFGVGGWSMVSHDMGSMEH